MKNNSFKKLQLQIDRHFGTLSILPALIGLMFVLVYPVIVSVFWSFTNKSIMRQSTNFIGFENFIFLFQNPELWISIKNGLVYTACTICLQIIWGVGAALVLDRFIKSSINKYLRLIYLIPWTFPVIVTVLVWGWLLNDSGIFSTLLFNYGLISEPMSFLASKTTAMLSIIFIHSWTGFPLIMMSTIAGLQAIPQDQYDVALIEGASPFQNFKYIILPNIQRILNVIIVLRCVWIFNNFNMIFLLTGGGPGSATQNLPILAYKYAWNSMEMGKSSAVSFIMLLILITMFCVYNIITKKIKGDEDAF